MPAQHTLYVALTQPLVQYVGEQVATEHYATASEVVRVVLQVLIERDATKKWHGAQPEQTPAA